MAIPANVILPSLGTHAGIPSGFTRETTLDDRYPLGAPAATNPNVTGGAATHTHATSHTHGVGTHTHTGGTSGNANSENTRLAGAAAMNGTGHNHTAPTSGTVTTTLNDSGSVVTATGSSLPSSFGVIWIKSDGTPPGVPDGREALWTAGTQPTNWTVQSGTAGNLTGKYLVGAAAAADAGTTSGSATHVHAGAAHNHVIANHTHTIASTGGPSATGTVTAAGGQNAGSSTHTHTTAISATPSAASGNQTSGDSGATDVAPAYRKVAVIRNGTGAAACPIGIVGAWLGTLATIPTGWVLCDGTNGTVDLRDKMIVAAATDLSDLGNTGGATNHDHTNPSSHTHTTGHAHSTSWTTISGTTQADVTGAGSITRATHTHASANSGSGGPTSDAGTEAVANASAYPPNRTVAFIQFNYESELIGRPDGQAGQLLMHQLLAT